MVEAKKVYIMGAGTFGEFVCRQLQKYHNHWKILGYIDSDISKKDTIKDGIKIYHLLEEDIPYINKDTIVFLAISDSKANMELVYKLNNIGFSNIYEIKKQVLNQNKVFVKESELRFEYVRRNKIGVDGKVLPIFSYVETHVMDGCNLKCKGCSHFSNLFKTDAVVEYEQFRSDIERLSQICNVVRLRLLGGEPLLNERLEEYLAVVRQAFPGTDIHIATNGILILKCKEELLKYVSANNIAFDITMYKPVYRLKEEIQERLERYQVAYHMEKENLEVFNKALTVKGNNDAKRSIEACSRKDCLILKEGRLYRCPISAYIMVYNERYGTNIESEELFNIYTGSTEKLREIATEYPIRPVSTCKYCVSNPVNFSWESSPNPQKTEWLV